MVVQRKLDSTRRVAHGTKSWDTLPRTNVSGLGWIQSWRQRARGECVRPREATIKLPNDSQKVQGGRHCSWRDIEVSITAHSKSLRINQFPRPCDENFTVFDMLHCPGRRIGRFGLLPIKTTQTSHFVDGQIFGRFAQCQRRFRSDHIS